MHEFRLHAHAASSSNIFAFATMSTSAEEQRRKLFEEFCVRIYATARSKTISQLEGGSEFAERCDVGGGARVSGFLLWGKIHEFRLSVAINESFLRENLFSSNSRKFSPAKETCYIYGSSRVVKLRRTTQNHGKAIIAENYSLVKA